MNNNRKRQQFAHYWLAPLCLVLAFQTITRAHLSAALQTGEHQVGAQAVSASDHSSGPMLSLGSESSAALEASAALAGDDLLAAESSQSPSDSPAEHKAFTSAQMLRAQEPQQPQMAASVAPAVFAAPPQQQPQAVHPQQQLFGVHPQHMQAMQARMSAQHQQAPPKAFNPFMAAALAGNYGPAQQQIAAAAAAAAGLHPHPHPQQQQQPQQAHPQQAMLHQQQQAHNPHQQQQQQQHHHQPSPQQQHQQLIGHQRNEPAMVVQESSVRHNVLPAPNFNSMAANSVDSNSIELNDAPAAQPQQPHQQQQQAHSTQLATASSAQHPVIASASQQPDSQAASAWPLQAPDIPKIVNLEVKCEKNLMKVSIEFDKVFNGVIFSKGHYSQGQCVHVGQNSGKQQAYFDISINSCGTQGNTQNGLYGMGGNTGSGTYFENTIVVQYDPNVQEVYDHARKLRCTWHDQYEKAVTFRPFPVDMLDIVRADFAGDNVGCWMQIQVGKGPWASEVAGIVKIGQTMTMVLAIKDEENKFDMLVRNCFAHDGKRGPIELVDKSGCITRPKLMSRFTKIKNFGSSATVLSYAHFQAFKFPDSMEVHFQCTIQICRHQCPEQCSAGPSGAIGGAGEAYSESTISGTFNIGSQSGVSGGAAAAVDSVHLRKYGSSAASISPSLARERRDVHHQAHRNGSSAHHHLLNHRQFNIKPLTQSVGLNRVIQVVSSGDLAFAIQQQAGNNQQVGVVNGTTSEQQQLSDSTASQLTRLDLSQQVCMSSYNFVLSLVVLALILLCSCLLAISLYIRQRSFSRRSGKLINSSNSIGGSQTVSNCSSPCSTMRSNNVPSKQQLYHQNLHHNHHPSHSQLHQ